MDTVKVFDTLDRKIERLIERLKSLEGENERLKNDVASARKAEKEASGSRERLKSVEAENEKLKNDLAASRKAEKEAGNSKGVVEKMEREQTLVRERLEKLIGSLEAAEEKR